MMRAKDVVASILLIGASVLAVSCLGDDSIVEYGVIDHGEVRISIPDRAERAVSFMVSVVTWGGCITAEATDVTYQGDDVAVVEVFDRRRTLCKILKLCVAHHAAQLRFETPGKKTILFRGRNLINHGSGEDHELVDFPAHVVVE